ncbi:MAG: N-6 DNA methylase, partial [Candidatus Omnitrophica bacterium]|nr:N-6 DNA methylase [Candidatus Omnitrophota bacterium]
MKKKHKIKIKEKPGRIGNLFESEYVVKIKKYIEDITKQYSESAKSQRFTLLLKELFENIKVDFIDKYLTGIERYITIKDKDICIKGEVDAFYGNLIIEFEKDLNKNLKEAQAQLKKYSFILYKNNILKNPLTIATDGLNFMVYLPLIEKASSPDEVELREIQRISFIDEKPEEIYLWLDRYFMRTSPKSPTTEEIKNDFGLKSPLYNFTFASLMELWNENKNKEEFKIIFDNWEKYIGIVYGSEIGSDELFIRHTYLATLAKLMILKRFSEGFIKEEGIIEALKGHYFSKRMGILNFLEEDFFSWIVRENIIEKSIELSKFILNHLETFNLRELREDIFKSLYQELVDPETRHDLGEFYTPDWLAEKMVQKVLEDNVEKSILDPACGSGTFLYMAIKTKKDQLKKEKSDIFILKHILENVIGIDIHPLAVIISKANYLLALGDLIKKKRKEIKIPVYLANSIEHIEEKEFGVFGTIPIHILPKKAELPIEIVNNLYIYDLTLEVLDKYAREYAGKEEDFEVFKKFIKRKGEEILNITKKIDTLYNFAKILKELIETRKDTIWTFILKNLHKPIFLKEKFDVVIGNPPWLSFRYIKDPETQK